MSDLWSPLSVSFLSWLPSQANILTHSFTPCHAFIHSSGIFSVPMIPGSAKDPGLNDRTMRNPPREKTSRKTPADTNTRHIPEGRGAREPTLQITTQTDLGALTRELG